MNNPRKFALLLSLLVFASPLVAEEDYWRFQLSPYVWFAGLKGDVTTVHGVPPVSIDISPNEAFDDTEASLMVLLDAKRGRHGVFADLLYSDVRSGAELVPPPINLILKSDTETTLFTLAYQYQVYRGNGASVDLMADAPDDD